MPGARPDVIGDRRLKFDLDVLRRTRVHTQRIGKGLARHLLDRRKLFLEQRELLDSLDRKRADFAVLSAVERETGALA